MRDGSWVEGDGKLGGWVDIQTLQQLAVPHVGDDEQSAAVGHVQLDELGEPGDGRGQVAQDVGVEVEEPQRLQLADVLRQVVQAVVLKLQDLQVLQVANLFG